MGLSSYYRHAPPTSSHSAMNRMQLAISWQQSILYQHKHCEYGYNSTHVLLFIKLAAFVVRLPIRNLHTLWSCVLSRCHVVLLSCSCCYVVMLSCCHVGRGVSSSSIFVPIGNWRSIILQFDSWAPDFGLVNSGSQPFNLMHEGAHTPPTICMPHLGYDGTVSLSKDEFDLLLSGYPRRPWINCMSLVMLVDQGSPQIHAYKHTHHIVWINAGLHTSTMHTCQPCLVCFQERMSLFSGSCAPAASHTI